MCLSAGTARAQKSADDFLKSGQAQYAAAKYDDAIISFSECVRLDPKAHRCFFERGKGFHEGKLYSDDNYKKSIADYSEAIRLKPDFVDAYQKRAMQYYFGKSEYANAYPDLLQVLKLKPKSVDAAGIHMLIGNIHQSSTVIAGVKGPNYPKAVEAYTVALKLDARADSYSRPDYFSGRAAAHLGAGAVDKAIADITEAIKLKPTNENYNYSRAIMFERKGDHEKALQDLSVYLGSSGGGVSIPAFQLRASIYCKAGKHNLAAADEAKSAALGLPVKSPCKAPAPATTTPTTTTASAGSKTAEQYFAEGKQLAQAKNLDGAIASFTKCIEAKADAFPCFLMRGTAHAQKGNNDAAIADLNRTIELNPTLANAFATRGLLHLKLRKKDLATSDFRAALKLEPDHSKATQGLKAAESMR